jgi:hypothetical protein
MISIDNRRIAHRRGGKHMRVPDALIYDEIQERKRKDGGLQPLHLPLYQPEPEDWHREEDEESEEEPESERGVVIIDMNTGLEIDD